MSAPSKRPYSPPPPPPGRDEHRHVRPREEERRGGDRSYRARDEPDRRSAAGAGGHSRDRDRSRSGDYRSGRYEESRSRQHSGRRDDPRAPADYSDRALSYGERRGEQRTADDHRSERRHGSERDAARSSRERQNDSASHHDRRRDDHRSVDRSSRHESPAPPLKSAMKKRERTPEAEFELEPDEQEMARIIEERRRRRAAILLKHTGTESTDRSTAAGTPAPGAALSAAGSTAGSVRGSVEPRARTRSVSPVELAPEQGDFALAKTDGTMTPPQGGAENNISAADYNPDLDRLEDEERARQRAQKGQPQGTDELAAGTGEAKERIEGDESEWEEVEVEEDDEVEDMFALGSDDEDAPKKKKTIRVRKGTARPGALNAAADAPATLTDNWDDADGYYRVTLGERLGDKGQYHVFANLGRGMFSSVVKAREVTPGEHGAPAREREVAIKIVRSQETMYKAGIKEMAVLQKLMALDPEDKRHLIRLEGHFEHRGHLCMVFELLSMNLRDVVKRFGKDVGLNLRAVRAYAHQMFLALSLMRKANIMHADIKPDNILVNEGKTTLKICDLGSASDTSEMEITPYLVSRFYRAPEIILGQPYDCALDMWSIGCTLYELATGKILFPGRTNNQMLLLIQELRGKFTTKQIRKGRFSEQHFDETNTFLSLEKDKSTGADVIRKVALQKPVADLRARLLPGNTVKRLSDDELRLMTHFIDLLARALDLDPTKRLTPKEALAHPFLA